MSAVLKQPEPLQGFVHGMPNDAYHAHPAIGSTGLKTLARSPAHFYGQHIDPKRPKREATPAMKAGTLLHCVLLEPSEVDARYVVRPDGLDARTKAGKEWMESASGREIVTSEALALAKLQAASLRAFPDVGALLSDGEAEVSVFWIDPETGAHCKCRPDFVAQAGRGVILVDAKTTQDASPQNFPRSVWNFGYHLQAAHYSEGYERATGVPVLGMVFAAVEADYPHAAAAYMLSDEAFERGRIERRRLLSLYADCLARDQWPAYSSAIEPINLPAWA